MVHAHLIQLHQHYLLGQVHKLSTEVSEMITVVIDGFEVTVPKGTLVIRAAEQLGIQIPRFCDHPLLDPVGACRQCLVDIEINGRAFPKPQASCCLLYTSPSPRDTR